LSRRCAGLLGRPERRRDERQLIRRLGEHTGGCAKHVRLGEFGMAGPDVLHLGDGIADSTQQVIKGSSSCTHGNDLWAIAAANMTQTPALFADTPALGLAGTSPRMATRS